MGFVRTVSGLIAEHKFRKGILIYFEGITDFPFYEKITRKIPCKFKPAGGKEQCLKLARELKTNDYPYIVIMDGDYEILSGNIKSGHKRIIYLRRYAYENYLFELFPLQKVASSLACIDISDELETEYLKVLKKVTDKLKTLVFLDIVNFKDKADNSFPSAEELFTRHKNRIDFKSSRIEKLIKECNKQAVGNIEESKTLFEIFLREKRLVDLMHGKFILGLIKKLICTVVSRRAKNINLDKRSLIANLCSEVWMYPGEMDHQILKRKLRDAIRTIKHRLAS